MDSQKKIEKDKKQFNYFKKYIYSQLKEFEKCRQWADINNWLHDLYKHLQSKHFDQLPNAVILAKRLAQCLSHTLPSGVHDYALKVYTLILTNFDDQQNIRPLMSIGLFPFFQVCSSQLKFQLLKIYENFFLNDDGCLQMMISLTNALLTGLNENNEELAKKIFILSQKISKKYGYIWFNGAVWVNILKSSKVKIAGFKYFMKVFKDRDKQKNNKEQLKQQGEQIMKQNEEKIREKKSSFGKKSFKNKFNALKQEETVFLAKLYEQKNIPDGPHNRYPNFSTLVVNAIRSCLELNVDSLAKRAALQHVSTYLKLSEDSVVSHSDALILVSTMLRVLTCKQFSLTRRIYLYLFGQPNTEGQYLIDSVNLKFQIKILIQSLRRMLKQNEEEGQQIQQKNYKSIQSVLAIIQILIQDHEMLGPLILPHLSYDILKFIKQNCFSSNGIILKFKKKIIQFSQNVIFSFNIIFLQAILKKVQRKQEKQKQHENEDKGDDEVFFDKNLQNEFIEVLNILDFYIYTLYKAKYQLNSANSKAPFKKSSSFNQDELVTNEIPQEFMQICLTSVQKILSFLTITHLKYQKLNYKALEFANKINTQTLSKAKGFQFHENIIKKIDELILLEPNKSIYAHLLTLHPSPRKQILLPFINQGGFSIVCIQNLLPPLNSNHKIILTNEQQRQIFYAIFKLLECHLWQQQAYQFVKIFIQKYQETFKNQINQIQATQWLIYWRLASGDVKGGVIRMILNAESENPLKKNMSCKWIEANQQIISKIIEPIFSKLKQCLEGYQSFESEKYYQDQTELVYKLIKIVFQASRESFERFFFIQKEKYLVPLLGLIFMNLEIGSQKIKTKSMDMMKYVLSKTKKFQQKHNYMSMTLPRILSIFKYIIRKKMGNQDTQICIQSKMDQLARVSSFDRKDTQLYLQEIQIVQYLGNLNISIRKSLQDKDFKFQPIIQLFQANGLYVQVAKGLFQSDLAYLRTLYLDFLKDSCDMLAKSQGSKNLLNHLINHILDKLFLILKTQDVSEIEEAIRQKKEIDLKNSIHRTRRMSSADFSDDLQMQKVIGLTKDGSHPFFMGQQNITKNDMNIEAKYAQIIEMWNSVKFYTKFSLEKGIQNLPIVNLLSLILQSFPFSYLKYTQMKISTERAEFFEVAVDNYEQLQQEINNITGLKKQVMQIIEIVWSKYSKQICEFLIQRGDPRILIHCTIDPAKVLSTIINAQKIKQLVKYYNQCKFNLPKTYLHYSGDILNKQNQTSYFLYLYLMYCNFNLMTSKKLSSFLNHIVALLQILRISQHIQTKLWILQLLYLLSERILLNKDAYLDAGNKIKQQIQQITKETLDELVKIIGKSKNFTFKTEIKTGIIANLFSKEEKQITSFDFIKMNPPTIFVMSQLYNKRHNKRNNQGQLSTTCSNNSRDKKEIISKQREINYENELIEMFLFEKWLNLSEESFQNYLSVCCIKTLISISSPLIINIYEKDLVKVSYTIKEIILALLPICQDKCEQNQFRIQLISEYIYHIIQNKPLKEEILPLIRRNILAIFMGNVILQKTKDFFKTTKRSLFYWKQIIDACTEGEKNSNHDLLGQLLARQSGLFQGLLKGKQEVLRQKIKSFQRICFVIYSGRIDKYQGKLNTVLVFLNDVMKQQNSSPALLILMIFCIRILFMRLSQTSLNKMFKSIWPGLISILIQIFNSKQKKKNRNINLILAALKVVELIHALQMEEFNLHKWIFITDFFGIKLEPISSENENEVQKTQILTPFIFKPYLTNLLPQLKFKCEYRPQQSKNIRQTLSQQKQKRKILIKQASIDTIQQLQNLAYILIQYMIDCNQIRVEVSKKQIEQLIEADFISLDDYIFQIK